MKSRVKDVVYNTQRTRNLYFTYTAGAGVEVEMLPAAGHADRYFSRHNYGFVQYELTNHLGNVHTTISNRFGFKRELYPPVTVPEIGIGDWFASQVTAEGDGGGALLVSGGPGEVGFHLDQNNTAPQILWFDIAGATTPLTVQCRDFYTDSLIAETTCSNGSNVLLFRTPNPGAVTFSWNTPVSQSFGISSVYMSTDIRSADIRSVNDYYSFHSLKPGRTINFDDYRFGGSNGQEADDEIMGTGNIYTAEFWQYDSRLGRRWNLDPVDQISMSNYAVFRNNPVFMVDWNGDNASTHTDKDGNVLAVYDDGDMGVYKHESATSKTDIDKTYSRENTSAGGIKMGVTLEWNSFLLDGDPSKGVMGRINYNSMEAGYLIGKHLMQLSKTIKEEKKDDSHAGDALFAVYAANANNFQKYDLKSENMPDEIKGDKNQMTSYYYRGSQLAPGVFVSARDAGNILAGMVGRMAGFSAARTFSIYGSLQLSGNSLFSAPFYLNSAGQLGASGNFGETPISHTFQRRGYELRLKP